MNTLIEIVKRDVDASFAVNAAYVIMADGGADSILWCDQCFPKHKDGSRFSWEDVQDITGLSKEKLLEIDAEIRDVISIGAMESELPGVR